MADTTITVGSAGNLVMANEPTRGVTFEVWSSWDYALFANDANNPGTPVVFRQQGNGYIVEMTNSNYSGYVYWTFGLKGDIYLVNSTSDARVWTVSPATNGFKLMNGTQTVACNPTADKRWLSVISDEYSDARKYVVFQFSKV
ncbi:hypothetical protein ADK70_09465 [Streptomyces rimosus subsp. pseudoverticillatus]|uniref:hypothetical protein n=1 Tax=Streptomyces rimosus TaxID=1927 RepID=UPI0006B288D7|nr:hypothetical protein [Streptomyces rimosus]KOT96476.1 hypothetical protein ADK70_09465 [Streptomyces rimosus subsp. pseudoverticillatus]